MAILDIEGYRMRMDEWWESVVAQHHQGIRFQGVKYELRRSLRPGLQFWA